MDVDSLVGEGKFYEAAQKVKSSSLRILRKDGPLKAVDSILESHTKFQNSVDTSIHMVLAEQIWWMSAYIYSVEDFSLFIEKIKAFLFRIPSAEWNEDWNKFVCKVVHRLESFNVELVTLFRVSLFRDFVSRNDLLQARRHLISISDEKEIFEFLVNYLQRHCSLEEKDALLLQVFLQCFSTLKLEKSKSLINLYIRHFDDGKESPVFSLPLFNFIFYIVKAIEENKDEDFIDIFSSYRPILSNIDPKFNKDINSLYLSVFQTRRRPLPGFEGNFATDLISTLANSLNQNTGNTTRDPTNDIDVD